jgi:hypothetical protein
MDTSIVMSRSDISVSVQLTKLVLPKTDGATLEVWVSRLQEKQIHLAGQAIDQLQRRFVATDGVQHTITIMHLRGERNTYDGVFAQATKIGLSENNIEALLQLRYLCDGTYIRDHLSDHGVLTAVLVPASGMPLSILNIAQRRGVDALQIVPIDAGMLIDPCASHLFGPQR